MSELNQEQLKQVSHWVEEGASLSDIQKRIEEEFSLRMTYMDVRFLVDDLNLELKASGPEFDKPEDDLGAKPSAPPGKVSVTLDKVARPDALVSGQVTFSDGETAQWYLDQMGRLGLNASKPGYKPSQEDLAEFQKELQSAVESSGMM